MIPVKWVKGSYLCESDIMAASFPGTSKAIPVIELAALTEVVEGLKALVNDCMASDFNEHWESYKEAQRLLTQLEGHTKGGS
jgi:hypothetical protein